MSEKKTTNEQLIRENEELRNLVAELQTRDAAFEASEGRYRRLFETAKEGILILDAETGRIDDVNPYLTDLTGYSREDLLHRRLWEIGPFRGVAYAKISFEELRDKELVRYEHLPLETRDGRQIDVEFASNVYHVNGQKVIQCNIRDITERKRIEEERRQNYDTQQAIDSILQYSLKTTSLESILNFALRQILSITWLAFEGRGAIFLTEEPDTLVMKVHANLSEEIAKSCARIPFGRCLCGRAAQTQLTQFADRIDERHEITYPGIQPHGHYCVPIVSAGKTLGTLNIYVHESSAYRKRDDRFLQVIAGALAGIIERRRAEEMLRESEGRFRTLFEQAADLIFLLEIQPDGGPIIRDVNGAILRVLGYRREEAIGRPISFLEAEPDGVRKTMDRVRDASVEGAFALEVKHRCKDGAVRVFECSVTEMRIGAKRFGISLERDVTERKRAEEALRKSEETYRLHFASVNDVVFSLDRNGAFLRVSPSVEKMLGYKPEELIGKPFPELNLLAPECLDRAISNARKVLSGDTISAVEYTFVAKDGSTRFGEMSSSPIFVDGKVVATAAVARDITERKRAEEALRKNEKQLSNAVEIAHLGHWEYDVANDLFTFNDHFYKLFRTTAAQAGGYTMSSDDYTRRFVHPDDASVVGEEVRKSIDTTDPHFNRQIEHRVIFGDGTTGHIVVRFFIVKDEQGRTIRTFGVNQDISERKRAEEALLLSAARWQGTFDAISDIVCILSVDHEFIEINEAGVSALGLPREAIIGRKCFELVHGTNAPIPECPCVRAMETGQPQKGALSAGRRHMELDAWPVLGKDSRLEGLVHVVKDITSEVERESEKKRLETQLQQAQKMETIGRLAGGVAHDFNNLLQVINTFAELSLGKLLAGDPLRKNLEYIQEAGERAATLTRQLLAFSRKQVLQTEILDINTTIAGMEKMLRRMIGEDIDLVAAYAADLGKVKADAGQIEQVLMNLAVNSRDAMPMGGKLTIETANVELDEQYTAEHVAVTPGSYVMLAVADTGNGMDEKTKAAIFEPFFTTKEKGKGTGLGLSTVYGIVKQSGGYIWVYSEPGKGTTFKIYLPRDTSDAEEAPPAKPAPKNISGTETILLVEDEENVRRLAEQVLKSAGFTVLACANAGEALLTCEQHQGPIHLMLTDVVMPQMGGKQLAERLSAIRPETKVLFMSGYTDDAIVRHGVLEKGTQFISKPFTIAALTRKVREVLDQQENIVDGTHLNRG